MIEMPSLWSNLELEEGLKRLESLQFEEASRLFKDAEKHLSGEETTLRAIDACSFWEEKVRRLNTGELSNSLLEKILEDYTYYEFAPRLSSFKKSLLVHFALRMKEVKQLQESVVILGLKLLEEQKIYDTAEKLISEYFSLHPKELKLFYLLARAEWNNGQKAASIRHYLQGFLCYPKKKMVEQVLPSKLKGLLEKYPIEVVPAYGWIEDSIPLVVAKEEIEPLDERHLHALTAYRCLRDCHVAMKRKTDVIAARKKLKEVDPEIFAAYMSNLR